MTAEIKNGNLIITIPAETKNPPDSASGKTRVVASSKGNHETEATVLGKKVVIGVNAYIKKD